MKNQKKYDLRQSKKRVPRIKNITLGYIMIGVLALCIYYHYAKTNKSYFRNLDSVPKLNSGDKTEKYIISKFTNTNLVNGSFPAFVYLHETLNGPGIFHCVGTVFNEDGNDPWILTSEHAFRSDFKKNRIFSVKTLRATKDTPTLYFAKILQTSSEMNSPDNVTARLGLSPVSISPFSEYHFEGMGQNYWGEVVIAKKPVPWLVSLISGEKVETIGYLKRNVGAGTQTFVLIDYPVIPGESGTGLVDQYGGVWTIHAGPHPEDAEAIAKECLHLSGKKIRYPTAVSGPIGGDYN